MLGDVTLPAPVREIIHESANDVFVSAASVWEITTKYRIGKLPQVEGWVTELETALIGQGFYGLPLTLQHGQVAGLLVGAHRDPFDRMLIAQALTENLILISNERLFDDYGVTRLW